MKVDVVVDVGNTRIKWGWCVNHSVAAWGALPGEDAAAWDQQLDKWKLKNKSLTWVLSGVRPGRLDGFRKWLKLQGHPVHVLCDQKELPLSVLVDNPSGVGMDRLLNAVAAKFRAPRGVPSVVIDAGTAVTVDLVDDRGRFRGGSILPGFRLMARTLHDSTALLPLVEITTPNPPVPAKSTESAIAAGVYWAVAGGVNALIGKLTAASDAKTEPIVYLTGGDAPLLAPGINPGVNATVWPQMTLEGVRIAAETLPEGSATL
jgi:type III pantothenate kinase